MNPLVLTVGVALLAFLAGIAAGWLLARKIAAERQPEKPQVELESRLDPADAEPVPAETPTELEAQPEEQANPQTEPESDEPTPAAAPARPVTELGLHLYAAADPVAVLNAWCKATHLALEGGVEPEPSPLEIYLLQQLEDAGIGSVSFSLPGLKVVRPQTNGMFYLRLPHNKASYGDTLSMYRLEAALNAGVIAEDIFVGVVPGNVELLYAAADALMHRITHQGSDILPSEPDDVGEWDARMALSHAIERLRLPFRLTTQFRMNVSAGEVAIEFEATEASVFPRHALVEGAGVVSTTSDMRKRAQADYTMRVAVLLANCAFAASSRINRVWVAAIERTPATHACLLSTSITRDAIEEFSLDPDEDVSAFLISQDSRLELTDGKLTACKQAFSLDEERFCPPFRYETIGLSTRLLDPAQSVALGTRQVSGLEIDEAARREQMAEDIAKRISHDGSCSCQEAVRAVLELSSSTNDEELKLACQHTAQRLVDGELEPEPLAIIEAICDDDGLVDAIAKAQELMAKGQHDRVEELMARTLEHYEATHRYADTPTDEWRCFSNYVDRVFYNLLFGRENVTTHLVPQTYVEALITRSISLMALDQGEAALSIARRACAICPMSSIVRMHLVQSLDYLGYAEESRQQLVMLLSQAHDAEGLGFGYYRMSIVLWQEGHAKASRAAFQRALAYLPDGANEALRALGSVMMGTPIANQRDLSFQEMQEALNAAGVPFAPTEEISEAFMRAAQASMDAEVFPVARDFLRVLGGISRNDVLFGVFRSLEDEPDR